MTEDSKLQFFVDRTKPHQYVECDWQSYHGVDGGHCQCGYRVSDKLQHPDELQTASNELEVKKEGEHGSNQPT